MPFKEPATRAISCLSHAFSCLSVHGSHPPVTYIQTVIVVVQVLHARLEIMSPLIVEEARRRFGAGLVIKSLSQVLEEEEEEEEEWGNVMVLGVLVKHNVLEPSELAKLEDEINVDFEPLHSRYLSQQDDLALEDQSDRLELTGFCLDPGELVSGGAAALSLVRSSPDTVL